MPTTVNFRTEIQAQIRRAQGQRRAHVEINAGELHRALGGYPPKTGRSHAMPSCCEAMRDEAKLSRSDIIHETDSGQSASLTIRYHLPR